jgi:hypothetical protein
VIEYALTTNEKIKEDFSYIDSLIKDRTESNNELTIESRSDYNCPNLRSFIA